MFLDAGVFTGLVETLEEAIRYPLVTDRDGGPTGPCVLAGPTCDSADVLYEQTMVELPLDLAEGDRVTFRCAGVYTASYSTVGFNGFAPLATVVHPMNRATRRLLVSYSFASIGTGLPWPLLLVLVWDQYGAAPHGVWIVGLAGAARMAPYVLLSWAVGSLGDHLRRDRLIRATLALRFVFLAVAAVAVHADRTGTAVVAAALAVAVGTPTYPAIAASLPTSPATSEPGRPSCWSPSRCRRGSSARPSVG